MESKLIKLKTDFNNIITVRTTVKNIFDILQIRIDKLKLLYAEFIKTSKNQMFVFGLDSFNFQSKLIDIEYDDMQRLFLAINNRMYCEYFKLYKIIIDYIFVNISDKKITELIRINNYPIYKDLEPFKEYKFEIILDIHENILNLLSILMSTLNNKENELLLHKNKQKIGLNIDNFITTFNYNIIVMREKITMFITYIEFFHKLHTKYLKRFANKIQLMYSHINNDIQFDESIDINKKNSDDSESSTSTEIINGENYIIYENKEKNTTTTTDSDSRSNSINSDELNINIPKNDNMSDRSRSDSILSNITGGATPKFNLNNLVKMSSIFTLKPTEEEPKQIEEKLSHDDLNDMFSSIDISCDSIINNESSRTESSNSNENNCDNIDNNIIINDIYQINENNNNNSNSDILDNQNILEESNIKI